MEYKFKINEFEGPLDLLLHLIKEAEMDIMDIQIALLTDQYLAYLESMQNLNLQIASEYLVIAAELMYLKSKTLLPKEDDDLEESEEFILAKEDLVNRLLEYQKYKEVTSAFKFLEEKRGEFHTKAPSDITEYKSSEIRLNEDGIPVLKKVVVSSGNKVAIGDDLEEAITNLLSENNSFEIEYVDMENMEEVIDSIIEANNNLKESMDAQDLEMVGKDLETLQTLLEQLEILRNQELEEQTETDNEEENNSYENNTTNDFNEIGNDINKNITNKIALK